MIRLWVIWSPNFRRYSLASVRAAYRMFCNSILRKLIRLLQTSLSARPLRFYFNSHNWRYVDCQFRPRQTLAISVGLWCFSGLWLAGVLASSKARFCKQDQGLPAVHATVTMKFVCACYQSSFRVQYRLYMSFSESAALQCRSYILFVWQFWLASVNTYPQEN